MKAKPCDCRFSIDSHSPLLVYIGKLQAAFHTQSPNHKISYGHDVTLSPLSDRELETLCLVAQGLSNTEISQRLYLALSTVKGHNLRIFDKLQAQNCTEAVARARELGLL